MYLKIHQNVQGSVVAVCDAELIGRVIEDKNGCLDLKAYRDFYRGEKARADEVKAALRSFGSANIVGKKAVNVVLELGLADLDEVKYINTIPYIQLYRI